MTKERIANLIGLGLLMVCFIIAAFRIFSRGIEELRPGQMVLRIAHPYLDPRVRDAFDAVIRDFETLQADLGRNVRVVQIPVPSRVYPQWIRTQVTGGTAPELIAIDISGGWGLDSTFKAQNLVVFDTLIDPPNPHNLGTPHEGARWRDTFIDGLDIGGFDFMLAQHFGVPLTSNTSRIVINLDLLERILAHPEGMALQDHLAAGGIPKDFDGFIAICEAVERYSRATAANLFPLAAHRMSMEEPGTLFGRLFAGQSQSLRFDWNQFGDYRVHGRYTELNIIQGKWDYRNPAFETGYRLLRKVGRYAQPGFLQMNREDALFYFAQERTLMMDVSSEEISLLTEMIADRFRIQAFAAPIPEPGHAEFGHHVVGTPISEGSSSPSSNIGIVNYHPEAQIRLALDFLHFITSAKVNERFAALSQSLPSIRKVPTLEILRPFEPIQEGYPAGPPFYLFGAAQDFRSLLRSHFYQLFSPDGDVERFFQAVLPRHREVLIRDIRRVQNNETRNAMAQDPVLASYFWQYYYGLGSMEKAQRQVEFLLDAGNTRDLRLHYFRRQIE